MQVCGLCALPVLAGICSSRYLRFMHICFRINKNLTLEPKVRMRTTAPKINIQISRAARSPQDLETDMPEMYNPTPEFSRVIKAGHMLRQSTDIVPLASGPLPEVPHETTMTGIFRSLVNQSIDPSTRREQGYLSRRRRVSESTCLLAEMHFTEMFMDAQAGQLAYTGGRIITEKDGEPIMVQKPMGQRTLLSLVPLQVAGITYPAGSLMGVHMRSDYQPDTRRYVPPTTLGRFDCAPAEDIVGLDFLRPTLLALSVEERATYLERPEWGYHSIHNGRTVAAIGSASLGEIRDTFSAQLEHTPAPSRLRAGFAQLGV